MTCKHHHESVLISKEDLELSRVKMAFRMPADQLEHFIQHALEETAKETKLHGFREGKAPKDLIEKKAGAEKVLYDGANLALRDAYVRAVLDEKIAAIGEPKVEIKKLVRGEEFEFEAVVDVLPQVKLGSYKEAIGKINEKFGREKPEAKEEEIQKELEHLAESRVKIVTVNRSAKMGDQVEVDFQVFQDKVAIEGGTGRKHPVVVGQGRFIPGFEEKLIGAKAGDKLEFSLDFPQSYHAAFLAGKKADFQVQVNLVQERQVPVLDDDFACSIGKFKSLEELKGNIREGILHEKKHEIEERRKRESVAELVKNSHFELPPILIEQEIRTMLAELEQDISRIGLTKERYLQQIKTTEEKLKEGWREKEAVERVKGALILRQVAKDNHITAGSEEIKAKVDEALQYFAAIGQSQEKLDLERIYEAAKGGIVNEKVFQHLEALK